MFKNIVTDVFFDLDHTLWDFDRNSALTFEKILKANNIEVNLTDFLEVYKPLNLSFWKMYREERISKSELRYQRLKNTFDALSYSVSDEMIDILSEEYIQYLSSFNHLFPNTLSILEYLQPTYKLHIITNGFREIQDKKMKNAGIDMYFDQVVNSETAGVKKPNPIIFEVALAKANARPDTSLMIGDSLEADILGAIGVGLHALHFNPHNDAKHTHCAMIDDLRKIKTYL